jgi:hypothetical protein
MLILVIEMRWGKWLAFNDAFGVLHIPMLHPQIAPPRSDDLHPLPTVFGTMLHPLIWSAKQHE